MMCVDWWGCILGWGFDFCYFGRRLGFLIVGSLVGDVFGFGFICDLRLPVCDLRI